MKLICAIGFCVFLFTSCKKSSGPSTPSSIEYKANGVKVQISGDRDSSGRSAITGAYYGCYVTKPGGSNYYTIYGADKTNTVLIAIVTANGVLSESSYSGGSVDVSFTIKDTAYGVNGGGEQIAVNVLRNSGGTIDATFSGTVSDLYSNKKVITEGRLNNLKIY